MVLTVPLLPPPMTRFVDGVAIAHSLPFSAGLSECLWLNYCVSGV